MLDPIFKRKDKYTKALWMLLIASSLAFFASFQLSLDKQHIAENPQAELSCSINAVLNCASVMKTPQASLFGFPNSWLGLAGFSVLFFVAASSLAGTRFSRCSWKIVSVGTLLALGFALWLFFDSLYVIQILCPWCILMSSSTIVTAGAILHIVLSENILIKPNTKIKYWLKRQYDILFVVVILALGLLLIYAKFGNSIFQ